MISNGDIYRAAHLVLQIHGNGASDHARQRRRDLLVAGDNMGAAVWRRVLIAMVELRAKTPPADTAVQ